MKQDIIDSIRDILRRQAYERGHYAGQREEDLIMKDLENDFEPVFKMIAEY